MTDQEPLQDGIYVLNEFQAIAIDNRTKKMFTAPSGDPKDWRDLTRAALDLDAVQEFYQGRLVVRGKLKDLVEPGVYEIQPENSYVCIGGMNEGHYDDDRLTLAHIMRINGISRQRIPFRGPLDGDREKVDCFYNRLIERGQI